MLLYWHGSDAMADYNVRQISELLNVDTETVRRWIRTNKLKGTKTSKKTGFVVPEAELKRFLNNIPKYSGVAAGLMAATIPGVGFPITAGALVAKIISSLFINNNRDNTVTSDDIIDYVKEEIKKEKAMILQKEEAIQQLKIEIQEKQEHIEGLRYLLDNTDFQQIADSINKK